MSFKWNKILEMAEALLVITFFKNNFKFSLFCIFCSLEMIVICCESEIVRHFK